MTDSTACVRFFTRHDFGGLRSLLWLPVRWASGEYVHCELRTPWGEIANADFTEGVQLRDPSRFVPSLVIEVPVDGFRLNTRVKALLGRRYSFEPVFRLALPRWSHNPKGFVCSELVADLLQHGSTEQLAIVMRAVPPHRWTPCALAEALQHLGYMQVPAIDQAIREACEKNRPQETPDA